MGIIQMRNEVIIGCYSIANAHTNRGCRLQVSHAKIEVGCLIALGETGVVANISHGLLCNPLYFNRE